MATSTTTEVPVGQPIDLSQAIIGLDRERRSAWLMGDSDHGPPRMDGYTVGAPLITGAPPHNGEMHPDADELLYIISGRAEVRLELASGERVVELRAGQALVVPRGVWHQITQHEPYRLLHITPGPGGEHRPLERSR